MLRRDRNRPLPLADALALAVTSGARLIVNEQSHRAAVQVPAASLMLDDGQVQPRTRLVRPMARDTLSADDFARSHWHEAAEAQFAALWQAECAKVPEFADSEFHIITGLLIADLGPAAVAQHARLPLRDRRRASASSAGSSRPRNWAASISRSGPRPLPFRQRKPGPPCSTAAR